MLPLRWQKRAEAGGHLVAVNSVPFSQRRDGGLAENVPTEAAAPTGRTVRANPTSGKKCDQNWLLVKKQADE